MKKNLIILLCVICLFGVVGCGKTVLNEQELGGNEQKLGVNGQKLVEVKAEIVTNDEKKEEKSWYELYTLLNENNEYFKKHYEGAKVKIIDTVYKIKKETDAYEVVLSSGWYVYINKNFNDLSEVLNGTKVEIESYIYDNDYWPIMDDKDGKSTIKILSD